MTEPTPSSPEPPVAPTPHDQPNAPSVGHRAGLETSSLPAWRPWLTGRAQWAELIESPHTPAEWAVIGEAIRIADARARVHTDFGEPVVRGDEDWCQYVFAELDTAAATTNPYQAPGPSNLPAHCWADPALIRAWLNAPNAYSDEVVETVADTLDLVTWGQASDGAAHRAADTVLSAAQDAGVFGLAGHRVECHRIVDPNGFDVGHLLVARPPIGPGVAAIPTNALIPTSAATPIEGAVAVIAAAAAHIDAALTERDYAAAHPTSRPAIAMTNRDPTAGPALLPPPDADVPYRIGPQGRPFPALNQVDPTATTPPAPPPPPPTTGAVPADPRSPARSGRRP